MLISRHLSPDPAPGFATSACRDLVQLKVLRTENENHMEGAWMDGLCWTGLFPIHGSGGKGGTVHQTEIERERETRRAGGMARNPI
jgi:hypothetical protein